MAKPIVVQIVGDAKQFTSSLDDAGSKLESFAAQFATPGGAALAYESAIIGVGTALFKMGESVDDAYDHIRITTGATGDALAALEGSVDRIALTSASSFGQIAEAVAGLSQRLHLTGPQLDAMAKQVLDLSRITGTDLGANITAISGLMNNWGIATGEQTGKLDELYRASEQTGVSVTDLASTMAQNGAVLRDAGFDFESAAAFIGELGRRGVDATTVIAGLRHAEAALAEEHTKAQQEQARASQAAADRIVAANERRRASEERLAQIARDNARQAKDAAKALADATETATEVETDAAKDVARAKEDAAKLIDKVQKPVNDGAVAMADYNKRLADAQKEAAEKVSDAEDTAAKRRKDAAKRVTDSQERVAQVAEDSAYRVDQAHKQAADATERANARVRTSSADTTTALSKDGETSAQSIQGIIDQIERLGPGAEAQGLALRAFGSRAGEQMYAQLTQGKAGVDNLTDTIVNGTDTIEKATQQTDDFKESWARLKNTLEVDFKPVAIGVFDAVGWSLDNVVVPKVRDLVTAIDQVKTGVVAVKGFFEDLWNTVAKAPAWFGGVIDSVKSPFAGLGPGHAAGGQVMTAGFYPVGERGRENVWLPQGAQVQPSWSGGGGGGDTYNIQGYDMSPAELAREIAWQRRRGNGR